jgi:hypothetical protein
MSSTFAYYPLLGNEFYLVHTSELNTQLFNCLLNSLTNEFLTDLNSSQSQSHIATDGQSVSLGIEPHLEPMTRYLFLSDSYVLVSVGRPL